MTTESIEPFFIIGISVRTSNENGQAGTDIPALWNKFLGNDLGSQIPGKISNSLYCIYTEYELDHTRPYTTVLGCRVTSLTQIPEGMTGLAINGGTYIRRTAKGDLHQGVVFNEWTKIWNAGLPRVFTADFEVYDERSHNPENAEVDIFIAV